MRKLQFILWVLMLGVVVVLAFKQQQLQQQMQQLLMPKSAPKTAVANTSPATGVSSYSATVSKTAPAVVNIFTTQKVEQHPMLNDPVFKFFFDGQQPQAPEQDATSLGSGVIVDAKGYVLTNNHVIAQADTIIVALQDGRRANAKVIGTDPDSDLAVLQVDMTNLPVLPFRTTPAAVGDVVLAIGNPFGVGQTVTQGIISATDRTGLGINTFENFVQTDAAINPGNSGGALVDVAGNLVGINTAIFSKSGGNMGIGFAIPAQTAMSVMNDLITNGKVKRGWLGVEVQDAKANNPTADIEPNGAATKPAGVRIMGVVAAGPADKAGLRAGDTIMAIQGKPIATAAQLIATVANTAPNNTLPLLVQRNGQVLKMEVKVGERPSKQQATGQPNNPNELAPQQVPRQGMLPPELERFLFGR